MTGLATISSSLCRVTVCTWNYEWLIIMTDTRSLFNCVLTTLNDIFNEDLMEDLVNNPKGKLDLENLSLSVKTLQGKQGRGEEN